MLSFRENLGAPLVFGDVCVAHRFSFLCCVLTLFIIIIIIICLVCLRPVS